MHKQHNWCIWPNFKHLLLLRLHMVLQRVPHIQSTTITSKGVSCKGLIPKSQSSRRPRRAKLKIGSQTLIWSSTLPFPFLNPPPPSQQHPLNYEGAYFVPTFMQSVSNRSFRCAPKNHHVFVKEFPSQKFLPSLQF